MQEVLYVASGEGMAELNDKLKNGWKVVNMSACISSASISSHSVCWICIEKEDD